MVTPLLSPRSNESAAAQPALSIQNSSQDRDKLLEMVDARYLKFPLFNKLLQESKSLRNRENEKDKLRCPATAPVLQPLSKPSSIVTSNNKDCNNIMDAANNSAGKREDVDDDRRLIKLQDPPKTKMKRQLSTDAFERSDIQRICKKALIDCSYECHAEIDAPDAFRPVSTKHYSRQLQYGADEVDGCTATTLDDTIVKHGEYVNMFNMADPSHSKTSTPVYQEQTCTVMSTSCLDNKGGEKQHRLSYSPTRFNLSEIGLTSPFLSVTPKSQHGKEIFVFPDSIPPRRISPYKTNTSCQDEVTEDKSNDRQSRHLEFENITHEHTEDRFHEIIYEKRKHCAEENASYVSSKGFIWPTVPTVTQPIPISPRVATAEARPQFSSPLGSQSSFPRHQHVNCDENQAKLRILEREYARAKAIYGEPTNSQILPHHTHDVIRSGALRSISDLERSPNEKEILQTNEDVKSRYGRSFSDPRCSPGQIKSVLQQNSPLTCRSQYSTYENKGAHASTTQERWRDPWKDDVKRRLFMKSNPLCEHEYKRMYQSQRSNEIFRETTKIPEEVMNFLHSRNFHPEELENLKDVLRRGGSPQKNSAPIRHSASADEDVIGAVDNCQNSTRFQYANSATQGFPANEISEETLSRLRKPGDIELLISCESLTDNTPGDLEHNGKDCRCAKVEEEIRHMAVDAYRNIRRANGSSEAFEQYHSELVQTNAMIIKSVSLLNGMKSLCKFGRTIDDIYTGSIVFRLHCPSIKALIDLWKMYQSGELQKQMEDAFITQDMLNRYNCERITLKVKILEEEYLLCKNELEFKDSETFASKHPATAKSSALTVIHARSRSEPAPMSRQAEQILKLASPFRERIGSDSFVELSPRKAFQEINAGTFPAPMLSPSRRCYQDNVFFPDDEENSPCPRRRVVFFHEQENIE